MERWVTEQRYKYNFSHDQLVDFSKAFTSRNGDGTGDIEEDYFSCLKLVANCKTDQDYLDVGSGFGRIIDILEPNAKRIIGLEPDIDLFKCCRDRYLGCENIEIFNSTTSEYRRACPDKRFDVIVVSMVLQHVSTTTCGQILCDVDKLLAPNGVGIVATTHFFDERFVYQRDTKPKSSVEFDRYAENCSDQEWGLPVRMFSKGSFYREIERAALEVITWYQCSYLRPEKLADFARLYDLPTDPLRDSGISQFAVVRRRSDPQ
jgi:2-polyprenyl-3-methyl-5-hydroxy-6-metoxy-1,4-benzoquinol methylase